MTGPLRPPTPAWRVVRLLWAAARRRAAGRARRQREIMGRRNKGNPTDGLGALTRVFAILAVCLIHGIMGWGVLQLAKGTDEVEIRRDNRIAIEPGDRLLLDDLVAQHAVVTERKRQLAALTHPTYEDRIRMIKAEQARDAILSRLVERTAPDRRRRNVTPKHRGAVGEQFFVHGADGFVVLDPSLARKLAQSHDTPTVIVPMVAVMLAWWLGMLVCQGEGLELDVQRRRHPMWEWLLSHPIRPGHAFYAELLAPLMANPFYFAAPVFFWMVFGHLFGTWTGLLAALLSGLPVAVATSCLNKALETTAMLKLGARSRGAVLGMVSWFGYVAMILPFFLMQFKDFGPLLTGAAGRITPWFPAWPVRALTLGWGEVSALPEVVISWWVVSAALIAFALWVTHRATTQGLQAPTDGLGPVRAPLLAGSGRLGASPLHRKELLWLLRDKSAVVQVVLIPLTIGAVQAMQFRGLYRTMSASWAMLCGLAIVCGTYFLLVLGPRSLASEGGALWLSLTWPRGLEDLLKAKARLWSRIANVVVGAVLLVTCWLFPAAWWKILLVGCGWLVFGSTLSLKAVSLVTAPSSSGEPEPPDRAKRWIALIGTLAFGTGVMTQSWHVAIIGIVFSSLVSVAMWQGLRARLPYLFDPWSEQPVPAPSLLHATVGIALMVEIIGVVAGIASAAGGPSSLWLARALSYGLVGAVACVYMQSFLAERGVRLEEIIRWPGPAPRPTLPTGLALGAGAGAGLALLATGYLALLKFVPAARESLVETAKIAAAYEGQKFWIYLLAVGFAPIAEEYFFRGLLFRTLDRELGDWRALVLSAAFFAVFHPPLAWIPVACLGLFTAWLFKYTRHLLPCVACHGAYNAGVLLLAQLGN